MWVRRAAALYFGALGLGWVSATAISTPPPFASETQRRQRYDHLAKSGQYAAKISREDRLLRLDTLRSRLLEGIAPGSRVLEVAAGPATNVRYYPRGVSLTMIDCSADMVDAAGREAGAECTEIFQMDTERMDAFEEDAFDAVVDTFGLCSYENPEVALAEMRRVCRPGGTVLLLEHGQASWFPLNWYINRQAPKHSHNWGCVFNRDIHALVHGAGLEIDQYQRHHFGTTTLVVATVPTSVSTPP